MKYLMLGLLLCFNSSVLALSNVDSMTGPPRLRLIGGGSAVNHTLYKTSSSSTDAGWYVSGSVEINGQPIYFDRNGNAWAVRVDIPGLGIGQSFWTVSDVHVHITADIYPFYKVVMTGAITETFYVERVDQEDSSHVMRPFHTPTSGDYLYSTDSNFLAYLEGDFSGMDSFVPRPGGTDATPPDNYSLPTAPTNTATSGTSDTTATYFNITALDGVMPDGGSAGSSLGSLTSLSTAPDLTVYTSSGWKSVGDTIFLGFCTWASFIFVWKSLQKK